MRTQAASRLALPVVDLRWRVLAVALVGIGAVLVWAHVAVAALAVCLNETPGLSIGMRESLPISATIARGLLPALGQVRADEVGATLSCDAAAPARAMAVAGVAYLAGVLVLEAGLLPSSMQWGMIGLVAAAIQFGLFFMPGLLSSDILDYASHGRVAGIESANPYVWPPSAFPADPFSTQGAWSNVVTVYGPLWTDIDAALTHVLAAGNSVQLAFAYKALGLASHLVSIGLIWWIAGRWNTLSLTDIPRTVAVALWAWNPLVNIELIGSAHNEGFMTMLVLLAFALLTLVVRPSTGRLRQHALWLAALVCLGMAALVKFVPAATGAIVSLVWIRFASTPMQRLQRALVIVATLAVLSVVIAWPWLDSPAVAGPLLNLAAGGQRFKDAWQDAPAAWLAVRVVPGLGVPDDPATLRMDVARSMVWAVTRTLFIGYLAAELWFLWRRADDRAGAFLRTIAVASIRCLLMAILLFVSQVYAWYFLWPLPAACLLGLREPWSRAAIVFGLCFLPSFYLREFQPFGVFYLPVFGLVALAILALAWAAERMSPFPSPSGRGSG
jgi:hypothetical protein